MCRDDDVLSMLGNLSLSSEFACEILMIAERKSMGIYEGKVKSFRKQV
jgi:hypothetical protein